MNRAILLCVLLAAGVPAALRAEDNASTNQPPRRTLQVYTFSFSDPQIIVDEARSIAGTEGRVVYDKDNNRLIVIALPDEHAQISDLVKKFSVPARNIQIQVRITDAGTTVERGASADVRGTVVVPRTERSGVSGTIRVLDQTTNTSRDSTQFLTVMSGGRASITVGEELPFVDWFFDYGVRAGYLQSTTRWRQVGARLAVEPRVVGDGKFIEVKLIPELSYLVDGKSLVTAFVNAATEVTVANGQELRIGGSTGNQEFMSKVLIGFDSAHNRRAVDIILKPTILE
jgi:type II secretory pathway component GspD/PulD (secretin)